MRTHGSMGRSGRRSLDMCATRAGPQKDPAPELVLQREDAHSLLQTPRDDAAGVKFYQSHAAHLADALVVKVAQARNRRGREPPGLTAVEQQRKGAALVHLALEPAGQVLRAKGAVAQRAGGIARFLDAGVSAVVVRKAAVQDGAGLVERACEADDAAAVRYLGATSARARDGAEP